MHRWFYELVLHKGYLPSQEQIEKYGVPTNNGAFYREGLQKIHDEMGCLMARDAKIDYWRAELIRLKEDPATIPGDIVHAMSVLNKYLRGVYR